jgi:hypothetical protein
MEEAVQASLNFVQNLPPTLTELHCPPQVARHVHNIQTALRKLTIDQNVAQMYSWAYNDNFPRPVVPLSTTLEELYVPFVTPKESFSLKLSDYARLKHLDFGLLTSARSRRHRVLLSDVDFIIQSIDALPSLESIGVTLDSGHDSPMLQQVCDRLLTDRNGVSE